MNTQPKTLPLMPQATAVWLVDNTTLSFDQIAAFCGMHALEVQGIADGDVATGILGQDPVAAGFISAEAIAEAEKDESVALRLKSDYTVYVNSQKKRGKRYTPVAHRQDKPDAIAWLLKTYPTIKDSHIAKLVGTTKKTITAIRDRSHWNMQNIQPRDPVLLGLCTQTDLQTVADKLGVSQPAAEEPTAADITLDV